MAEYSDLMRAARDTHRIPWKEFLMKYDPARTSQLFCFVEGKEDLVFYNSKIRGVIDKSPITIICKRKSNVLNIRDEINKRDEYKNVKAGYFIDRDFDPKSEKEGVYETPCHSIENLYVQEETVKIILEEIFMIDTHGRDYQKALEFFRNLLELFHQKTLFVNAWICCQLENSSDEYRQLHIDTTLDKVFKEIVLPRMSGISTFSEIETQEKIEVLFNKATQIDLPIFNKKVEDFKKANHSFVFRGKFEIAFLNSFLLRLREILALADDAIWEKTYKPVIVLERNNILFQLADKVVIPQCLRDYILKLAA